MKSTSAKMPLNTLDRTIMELVNIDPATIEQAYIDPAMNKNALRLTSKGLKVISLSLLLFVSGCMSKKLRELPDEAQIKVPEAWQTTSSVEKTSEKSETPPVTQVETPSEPEPKPVVGGWLNSLNDEALNAHVAKALSNNPDLLSSAAQLKNAIETVTVTGSAFKAMIAAQPKFAVSAAN